MLIEKGLEEKQMLQYWSRHVRILEIIIVIDIKFYISCFFLGELYKRWIYLLFYLRKHILSYSYIVRYAHISDYHSRNNKIEAKDEKQRQINA